MNFDYKFYLCTDSNMCKDYNSMYIKIDEAIRGRVSFVQIREKTKSTADFLKIAYQIKKIAKHYNIPFVINDRVDIALSVDADGVHLGQSDMPCVKARQLLGPNKIIGVSVHTLDEAYKDQLDGADYLGIGAMFKSNTKPEAQIVDFDTLKKIRDKINLPIVIIGGINKKTIPLFKDIKIDGFAMISPILKSHNTFKTAKSYCKLISSIIES